MSHSQTQSYYTNIINLFANVLLPRNKKKLTFNLSGVKTLLLGLSGNLAV